MCYLGYVFLLLLFTLSGNGQLLDTFSYKYGNGNVAIELSSNKTFKFMSTNPLYLDLSDDLSCPEMEAPPIIWGRGDYYHHGDTIICIDGNCKSNVYYFCRKKGGDLLQFIKKQECNIIKKSANKQKVLYNDSIIKTVSLYELLTENPVFYLRTYSKIVDIEKTMILLDVYEWKDGKKKRVYHRNE